MKRSSLLVLLSVAICSLLIACKQEDKRVDPPKMKVVPILKEIKSDSKVEKELGNFDWYQATTKTETEIFVFSSNQPLKNAQELLAADKNYMVLSKYKKAENGRRILIQKDTLLSRDYVYVSIRKDDFLKKYVDGSEFIFFSTEEREMGQASTETTLYFFMIDMVSGKQYDLLYVGEETERSRKNETIEGSFVFNKRLNAKPRFKQLLLDYATNCKLIYKPSAEDKNILYYSNYAQKWEKDNKLNGRLANGYTDIPKKIYSTYYKENIIDFTGDISKADVIIENDHFMVVAFFRNNIIAYDKRKKRYFPIFIESCITGCNKEVKFMAKDKILITHYEYDPKSYELDLNAIIFKN